MAVHHTSKAQRNRILGLVGLIAGYALALSAGAAIVTILGVAIMLSGATFLVFNL